MKKEEIIEGNKLMAEFMGKEFVHWTFESRTSWLSGRYNLKGYFTSFTSYEELPYLTSWDWLMSVLDKIERLDEDGTHYNIVMGFKTYCGITQGKGMLGNINRWESSHTVTEPDKTYTWKPETKIEGVWIAIVKFLKWKKENENSKSDL